MTSIIRHLNPMIHVFLALSGSACAFAAQGAGYAFMSIDYPGVDYAHGGFTQAFGIDDKREIVGTAGVSGTSAYIPFVYNSKTSVFSVLPNFGTTPTSFTGAVGISKHDDLVVGGESVDGVTESGFILDNGAFTIFNNPGSVSFTEARAISNSGLVTGLADTGTNVSGFIYNPKSNSFIDFLPSPRLTVAQGINGRGDVVGSVDLDLNGAYPGSPAGSYGFLREASGAITLFRVNSGNTHARGITDSGLITGFVTLAGMDRGFVTKMADSPAFQSLTIADADLLDFPGSTVTHPEGISNSGAIVGNWVDSASAVHAFLATPLKK